MPQLLHNLLLSSIVHGVPITTGDGDYRVLTLESLSSRPIQSLEAGIICHKPDLSDEDLSHIRVQPGDVLLARKENSLRTFPCCEVVQVGPNTVPSHLSYLLRPNPKYILPGVLVWFLSLPATQHKLLQKAKGSQRRLERNDLEDLLVPVMSEPDQQEILQKVQMIWDLKEKQERARVLTLELEQSLYQQVYRRITGSNT